MLISIPYFKMILRDQRPFLITYAVSLILFELMVHWLVASSEFSAQSMKLVHMLPPAFKKFMGENMGLLSPLGFVALGYTHPMVYTIFAAFPAGLFGREIITAREKGTIELTLCRPLSRTEFIMTTLFFFICGLIFIGIMQIFGVWLGLLVFRIEHPLYIFFPVVINLCCLFITIGGYTMLISASAKELSKALTLIIGLTVGLYFLEFICSNIEAVDFLRIVNPFYYFKPQKILGNGGYPWRDMAVLTGAGLIFIADSFRRFRRRDI
ncbi:ABC transporter permease subunit [bacterium]|nr:ABC transporter permease subunit [FCB group bacterium]MBL7191391.1 ABC transporter permease subunit [bacterium]